MKSILIHHLAQDSEPLPQRVPFAGQSAAGSLPEWRVAGRLYSVGCWPELAHNSNYSVTNLAKNSGVSPRTLERFFSQVFGITPRVYLKRLRMHLAPGLLKNGMSVKEAADFLAYKDRSHFYRDFVEYYAVPPSQYRKLPFEQPRRADLSH